MSLVTVTPDDLLLLVQVEQSSQLRTGETVALIKTSSVIPAMLHQLLAEKLGSRLTI